ncbi:MAG: hypothetical protein HUU17_00640 [Chthonomonadales bacterium]|nr:hypothetical protein [Chthonomonadales bacterium]
MPEPSYTDGRRSRRNARPNHTPPSPDPYPVLGDEQIARRRRRETAAGLDLDAGSARASTVEELLTIGRLTELSPRHRIAYVRWVMGATIDELAHALGVSRATAARDLRAALMRCWAVGAPSFEAYSRHSRYEPPRRTGYGSGHPARCQVCAAPLWDEYNRETCDAEFCREIARHRRELDRRAYVRHRTRRSR